VTDAVKAVKPYGVNVVTVIGFPLGANTTDVKVFETQKALADGADEIDMVINIGAAKDGRFSEVGTDIQGVVDACKDAAKKAGRPVIVKTILETCLLDDNAIVNCCLCAKKAGADFVKTSTGFANPKGIDGNPLPNGASEHHVKLMRDTVGPDMGVKASGGIRSARTLITMLEAGASRIGTSSGSKIIENWDESKEVNNKY
jgi:deoxyribose-phosphate aldolase